MVMLSERWKNKLPFVFTIQLLCLLIMGIVEFLNMTQGCLLPLNLHLLMNGGIMLSLLGLWAISLWKSPRSILRRDVILGLVMVFWFLVVEGNRRLHGNPLQSLTIFFAVYLIALPFAALTQDQERQAGIRLVSGIYIAAASFLLVLGLILFIRGNFPDPLRSKIYWDGARLLVIHHPNITSRLFMIAFALSLGFLALAKRIWAKLLMLLAAVLLFAAIALTNTRAVILVTIFILAGNIFFLSYNKKRKLIFLGAAAAILAAVACFMFSNWLFQWNTTRLMNQPTLQAVPAQASISIETDLDAADSGHEIILPEVIPLSADPEGKLQGNDNSYQESLLSDLPTMNGRLDIWLGFRRKIINNPAILLRGVTDTRLIWGNLHTHNAWLEALIMLGLPGLLLVLFFSGAATWASLRLLLHAGTDLFRKNIALLTLATLVAALMEPCLFITYTEWNFSDFFFFLCLGYLTLWSKQISFKKQ